ncbi:hypothetical protein EW145_g3479 [Phellinidium pouzarii]|uniref:DUF3074 domain-containing protein n=1 Tax=Phellinidium pouzarii TaxID=167371 RepID=A0A4S4L6X8_9AGAM|nr:hypothetical protein EW145_g3479 [Phellinidium pouzarii]
MLLPSGFKLNVTPLKPASSPIILTDFPSEEQIVQAGRELVDATLKWNHSKDFCKGIVKGYVHSKEADDEEPWFCRVSVHAPEVASFDEMWFGLGTNKPVHEKEYVHTVDQVVLLKSLSDHAAVWNLHYKFPLLVGNRTFTVLQVTHLDTSGSNKSGLIVSIPVDVSSDAEMLKTEFKGTRGRYVSVERIHQLEDGKTEWRMATSSTPGGSIPGFLAQASAPGQIAQDVPMFLNWLNRRRDYVKGGIAENAAASTETPAEPAPEA